ncbi:MAG: hypothetical protein WB760_14290 [Xanthobacteraceae bacterium]
MLADAIHESGHAVVCVRLGYGHMLKSVTLDFCKYIIEPDHIPFRAWFVMSHAGPAASERHCRLNSLEVRKQSAGDARCPHVGDIPSQTLRASPRGVGTCL